MPIAERAKELTKARAATAAGGLFLANPLIATFLLGAGLAIWYAARSRQTR